jgi:hypothetical protein
MIIESVRNGFKFEFDTKEKIYRVLNDEGSGIERQTIDRDLS